MPDQLNFQRFCQMFEQVLRRPLTSEERRLLAVSEYAVRGEASPAASAWENTPER